jgi:deoxyribodipyrimidine photo-lyase
MIGARRPAWNFALDRAMWWARELKRPVVVLEPLRSGYRWASDRLHQFVVDGMRDNARAFERAQVTYYPYVEPSSGAGRGLLHALATPASVVITDDAPIFDLAALVERAAPQIPSRFEAIDGSGILPVAAPPDGVVFQTAYAFRRYLQRTLPRYLDDFPAAAPLAAAASVPLAAIPRDVRERWPAAALEPLDVSRLPIDHSLAPVEQRGGAAAANAQLGRFIAHDLARYASSRTDLDDEAGSRLSGYLHFGHISPHEVMQRVLAHDGWAPERISPQARGAREGWWGASPAVEAFLDQLITWRELGFHTAHRVPGSDRFETLPLWARHTLDAHAADEREHVYTLDQFARAATHDQLWNAAQRQLAREGRLHNYLRMLWGKKIVEWTPSPREARDVMFELNNRYALDGRDPNSCSGIMWVLGRYDRPWAPSRKVFGTVRYMSSANTARKLRVTGYLARYGSDVIP